MWGGLQPLERHFTTAVYPYTGEGIPMSGAVRAAAAIVEGMILADEVGLGKTSEAALVIAQRLAEAAVAFFWCFPPPAKAVVAGLVGRTHSSKRIRTTLQYLLSHLLWAYLLSGRAMRRRLRSMTHPREERDGCGETEARSSGCASGVRRSAAKRRLLAAKLAWACRTFTRGG
jgi:hypothetical protein